MQEENAIAADFTPETPVSLCVSELITLGNQELVDQPLQQPPRTFRVNRPIRRRATQAPAPTMATRRRTCDRRAEWRTELPPPLPGRTDADRQSAFEGFNRLMRTLTNTLVELGSRVRVSPYDPLRRRPTQQQRRLEDPSLRSRRQRPTEMENTLAELASLSLSTESKAED